MIFWEDDTTRGPCYHYTLVEFEMLITAFGVSLKIRKYVVNVWINSIFGNHEQPPLQTFVLYLCIVPVSTTHCQICPLNVQSNERSSRPVDLLTILVHVHSDKSIQISQAWRTFRIQPDISGWQSRYSTRRQYWPILWKHFDILYDREWKLWFIVFSY